MSTILVTGATDFIGGAVAHRLAADGHEVRAIVRRTSKVASLQALGVDLHIGDITDIDSLRVAAAGVDAIVHCAAIASDRAPADHFTSIDIEGTANAVGAALDAGVERFIHISSAVVFGSSQSKAPIDDHCKVKKSGFPCADTKIIAEDIVFAAHRERGLPAVVLRPSRVYGPGDKTFIPEVVSALKTRGFFYVGSRRNTMNLVYVDNVADAVVAALTNDAAIGNGYLVSGEDIAWKRIIDILCEELKLPKPILTVPILASYGAAVAMKMYTRRVRSARRPVLTRYALAFTTGNLRYDDSKIREELGWRPSVSFEEGMRSTVNWLHTVDIDTLTESEMNS